MKIEEIIIKKRTKRYKVTLDMDEYKIFAKGKLKIADCEELYLPVSREQFISEMKAYVNSISKIFCKENKKYISIETTEIHEGVEELSITPLTQIKKLILPKSLKNIEIKSVDTYYYDKEREIYYNGNLEDYCNLVFKTKKDSYGYSKTNTFTNISKHLLIQKDDGEIEYNGKKYSAYDDENAESDCEELVDNEPNQLYKFAIHADGILVTCNRDNVFDFEQDLIEVFTGTKGTTLKDIIKKNVPTSFKYFGMSWTYDKDKQFKTNVGRNKQKKLYEFIISKYIEKK